MAEQNMHKWERYTTKITINLHNRIKSVNFADNLKPYINNEILNSNIAIFNAAAYFVLQGRGEECRMRHPERLG
jgi:hypothetical protein